MGDRQKEEEQRLQLREGFRHTTKAAFCPQGENQIHQSTANPPPHSHGMLHTSMPSTRAQGSHSSGVQGAEKGPAGQRPPPGQHPVTNLAAKGPQKYLRSSCCPAAPQAGCSISARTWLRSQPSQQRVMKLCGARWIQGGQDGGMRGGEGTQGGIPKPTEACGTHRHC